VFFFTKSELVFIIFNKQRVVPLVHQERSHRLALDISCVRNPFHLTQL